MTAVAQPLPVIVIAEMLGVPAKDRDRFTIRSAQRARLLEPTISPRERKVGDSAARAFDACRCAARPPEARTARDSPENRTDRLLRAPHPSPVLPPPAGAVDRLSMTDTPAPGYCREPSVLPADSCSIPSQLGGDIGFGNL